MKNFDFDIQDFIKPKILNFYKEKNINFENVFLLNK